MAGVVEPEGDSLASTPSLQIGPLHDGQIVTALKALTPEILVLWTQEVLKLLPERHKYCWAFVFGDLRRVPVDAKHNRHPDQFPVFSTFSLKMFNSVHIWSEDLFFVKD